MFWSFCTPPETFAEIGRLELEESLRTENRRSWLPSSKCRGHAEGSGDLLTLVSKPGHSTRFQRIDAAYNFQLSVSDEFGENWSRCAKLLYDQLNIRAGCVRNRVACLST